MNAVRNDLPSSIAIAGAWGYIGRKFLDVALQHGLRTWVYDPGPLPRDLDPGSFERVEDPVAFHQLPAELFHLAVHPEHRRLDLLLARREPLLILNEKPMSTPDHPEVCARVVADTEQNPAIVLYDFPELFDPLTERVVSYLQGFETLRIDSIHVERSKDRENPGNPRNYKRMVDIQYQESVHCLAFVLFVLARLEGSVTRIIERGVSLKATSLPYSPPNPELYPVPVDGRCDFEADSGRVKVTGRTNFKAQAPLLKRRLIRGIGDGSPFQVEVSYLEGQKSLAINGQALDINAKANSYEHVLIQMRSWARAVGRAGLYAGVFPNPRFARETYRLSSGLLQSCKSGTPIAVGEASRESV